MDDVITDFANITNDTQIENISRTCLEYENIFLLILVIWCLVAMVVNIVVITSAHWIRSPMTPILKISLSLAAADVCSSGTFAAMVICDYVFDYQSLIIDFVRLTGIVITVFHLLALSLNHYIGILKPLHYNAIVTKRKVTAVICFLWICPIILMLCLWTVEGGAQFWSEVISNGTSNQEFLRTFQLRMSYSSLFFVPILLMAFFYTHILIIVKRQQRRWKNLSRMGSTKWRGRAVNSCPSNNKVNKEQRQLQSNIRAICTTLLIMGSCCIGWMPALTMYILTCTEDCYIHGKDLEMLNQNYECLIMTGRLIENCLVVMKMLANPIIYSIRMKEMQDGRTRMYLALTGLFCDKKRDNSNYSLACQRSPNHQNSGASMQVHITSFRINGNASKSRSDANTFL